MAVIVYVPAADGVHETVIWLPENAFSSIFTPSAKNSTFPAALDGTTLAVSTTESPATPDEGIAAVSTGSTLTLDASEVTGLS